MSDDMRSSSGVAAILLLLGVACGSSDERPGGGSEGLLAGFEPPPPAADEQRIVAPILRGIEPWADVTYCTYIENPWDTEVDVVQSLGFQSHFGHHALIMAVRGTNYQPGDSHVCTDEDMNNARFLAGGSDAAQNIRIPEGATFRIAPSGRLMVQTHWINASDKKVDGQAVFNIGVRKPDASRQTAALFTAYTVNVNLPAHAKARSNTECEIKEDLKMFNFGGHAHEWGTHVRIDRVRGGKSETLYDEAWRPAFQSAPPMKTFEVNAPLEWKKGDLLRVECQYANSESHEIVFPREMCVAFGFYFPATADLQCADGAWMPL